jgi:predicted AAA+ superfamily ATPase
MLRKPFKILEKLLIERRHIVASKATRNTVTYIPRNAESRLKHFANGYPVLVVTGPRQSGKSTLVRHALPEHCYVSLEDLDQREFAETDPQVFLNQFTEGAILDEAQRCPTLFPIFKHASMKGNNPAHIS